MSYIEAVIAIVVTLIAITAILFTIESQRAMYNKILQIELSKLHAEDLLLISLPNLHPQLSWVYVSENGVKIKSEIKFVEFDMENNIKVKVFYFENLDF
ncbi:MULTISPECIES: hypothetical protein [unclassified Thermosipho (in: thermotogales)]|uniref:hypothetical protein n=1 Tax=unclassified Thermosipho (in: thermotogales) TaxID=2676525 RepID=UPI0009864BAA|nr:MULTISPECIES: hypothetical protein [unclassified Thermosipho (in: thermotogales)]MBT1247723.1 hypothetical protein [Thermosipho sp. 1244]OOC46798.1 hypothetical protein XO09_04790 [Thermosipho sp. 1223]